MRDPFYAMRSISQSPKRGHREELQSIRGLSALTVVLAHCCFYYEYDVNAKSWVEFIFNAHAAVILFFVLSGYVLTNSLAKSPITFSTILFFYVRRLFRIFPALWLAIFIAGFYVITFHNQKLTDVVAVWWWPSTYRQYPVDNRAYFAMFLGVGSPWPLPLWTMKIELLASALLPIGTYFVIKLPRIAVMFSLVLSILILVAPWPLGSTANFAPSFALGSCIVIFVPYLRRYLISDRSITKIALLATALLLFGRNIMQSDFRYHYNAPVGIIIESFGGAILVALVAAREGAFKILKWPLFVRLGDISYSLYLIHLPIIGLIAGVGGDLLRLKAFTQGGVTATISLTVLVVTTTVSLSMLSYRYIELPCIELGSRFVDYSQKMIEVARIMVERNTVGHRS